MDEIRCRAVKSGLFEEKKFVSLKKILKLQSHLVFLLLLFTFCIGRIGPECNCWQLKAFLI